MDTISHLKRNLVKILHSVSSGMGIPYQNNRLTSIRFV